MSMLEMSRQKIPQTYPSTLLILQMALKLRVFLRSTLHLCKGFFKTNMFFLILNFEIHFKYLHVQRMEIPTSPGIYWEKKGQSDQFRKKIMSPGHSFQAQQWLCYMQETGYFISFKYKS